MDRKLILKQLTASSVMMAFVLLNSGPNHRAAACPPHQTTTSQILLGVSDRIDNPYLTTVKAQEMWLGKRYAVVEVASSYWCDKHLPMLFERLTAVWNNRSVPSLSWTSSENCVPYAKSRKDQDSWITNGNMDGYLDSFSKQLKTWLAGPDGIYDNGDDRRIYIRFDQEMNGNWFPWSATGVGRNTTADFINMWRHVWTVVMIKHGLDGKHVQWIWCVGSSDVGGIKMERYYPGDAYVDWVASDGYNGYSSAWLSPSSLFNSIFSRLQVLAPGKPLAIPEVGTDKVTSSGATCHLKDPIHCKNQWLTDLYTKYLPTTKAKMVVYYNHFDASLSRPHDWTFFIPKSAERQGDTAATINGIAYRGYSAHKSAVTRNAYVSADAANPRLLTDEQFAGHF